MQFTNLSCTNVLITLAFPTGTSSFYNCTHLEYASLDVCFQPEKWEKAIEKELNVQLFLNCLLPFFRLISNLLRCDDFFHQHFVLESFLFVGGVVVGVFSAVLFPFVSLGDCTLAVVGSRTMFVVGSVVPTGSGFFILSVASRFETGAFSANDVSFSDEVGAIRSFAIASFHSSSESAVCSLFVASGMLSSTSSVVGLWPESVSYGFP